MILFIFSAIAIVLHLFSLAVVFRRRFWPSRIKEPFWREHKVTIIRPVSGLENNLEQTLTSAFELDHPCYEVIFCVAKANDPVIPLCRNLIDRYRHIDARLLIGDDPVSDNPKLNNLVKGWKAAQYDWIAMTDSNVLMPKDYIKRCFARWDKQTGLVSSPPLGVDMENFPAELEAAFLNSYQARWQLTTDSISNGFAQGKTLFWRREVLNRAGGIFALNTELAEDAAATKLVRKQGLKVRVTAMPFKQPLGLRTFKTVWERQLRWAKLRRDSFPAFFYLEIISGSVFPFCCLLLGCLLAPAPFYLLLGYVILWYGSEFLVTAAVGWPFSGRQAFAMVARDILLILLWICAFKKGGYQWQGHRVPMDKGH